MATDVWAAAVMLYELICRRLPFGSRTDDPDDTVAARIATVQFMPPDHIEPYLPLRVRHFFEKCFRADPGEREFRTADALRLALPELDIRAEWVQWSRPEFEAFWEGHEVRAGERTGVTYSATARERPRLGKWEAEVKRAQPGGKLRRWPGVKSLQGTRPEAMHRMALWMKNITGAGSP